MFHNNYVQQLFALSEAEAHFFPLFKSKPPHTLTTENISLPIIRENPKEDEESQSILDFSLREEGILQNAQYMEILENGKFSQNYQKVYHQFYSHLFHFR